MCCTCTPRSRRAFAHRATCSSSPRRCTRRRRSEARRLTAVEWIAAHEPARGWYASPVGWFDLDGDGELAVAIRCGVFAGSRAQLWAGGGIVAGSDPERELAETEVKLRALIGAFGPVGERTA